MHGLGLDTSLQKDHYRRIRRTAFGLASGYLQGSWRRETADAMTVLSPELISRARIAGTRAWHIHRIRHLRHLRRRHPFSRVDCIGNVFVVEPSPLMIVPGLVRIALRAVRGRV